MFEKRLKLLLRTPNSSAEFVFVFSRVTFVIFARVTKTGVGQADNRSARNRISNKPP